MTDHDEQLDDQADEARPYDPLAALRIDELDAGSRLLKASLVAAITQQTERYERALAVVAYLHARRTDPAAKLSTFTGLTFTELTDQLGELAPPNPVDDDESPTAPAPG